MRSSLQAYLVTVAALGLAIGLDCATAGSIADLVAGEPARAVSSVVERQGTSAASTVDEKALSTVVEYYHSGFDHYFITSLDAEVQALDAGRFPGWARTGATFYVPAQADPGTAPVCRFFSGATFAPKSSHFYTAFAQECGSLRSTSAVWSYEGVAFYTLLAAGSTCQAGTVPLIRLYNNGQGAAPNHRFVIGESVAAQQVAQGWIREGIFGCVQAGTSVSSGPPPPPPPGGNQPPPYDPPPGGDYGVAFIEDETGEATFTLTGANPNHLDPNDHIDVPTTTELWAFTAAEYTAAVYALDFANAQLFLNGQAFRGYLLSFAGGGTGMNFVTVAPGRYWIGTVPGQSVFPGYSNRVFHEVSYRTLPGWRTNGNVALGTGAVNPGGWQSRGFTVPTGPYRAYIETEGMGGLFAVMTAAQFATFQATFGAGYDGRGFSYVYACGNAGVAATEIECELRLPPGGFALVYVNNTSSVQGGAGNISFFVP